TLAELAVVIALVAIAVALVMETRRQAREAGRRLASIALSSDGKTVIAGFTDGGAASWDTNSGSLAESIARADDYDAQYPVVICPDSHLVARILLKDLPQVGGFERALQVMDLATGREVTRRPITSIAPRGMAFSRDGSWLAFTGTAEAFVFDPRTPSA